MYLMNLSTPNSYFDVKLSLPSCRYVYIDGHRKLIKGRKYYILSPPLQIPLDSPSKIYYIFVALKLKYRLEQIMTWDMIWEK